jgi:putative serine protease PepD
MLARRLMGRSIAGLAIATLLVGCGTSVSSPPGTGTTAATPSSAPTVSSEPSATAAAIVAPSPTPATGSASTDVARQLEAEFVRVVATVSPSVVVITTDFGLGSGVVFDDRGDIVTNAHVVAGSTSFSVTTSDGHQYDATLVGVFSPDDLAVVRVSGADLKPATFGDSSQLVVGDIVMAVGNPLGLQSSVTEGIVSAVGRTVSEPGGAALADVIQTSAPINPGNSGGALVDLDGEVIGIPTLAATDPQLGGSAPGIGFAIPSDTAKDIAGQLIASGKVTNSHRAYLGVRAADVTGGVGVYVYSVAAGGPAADAGIPANVLIVSVDGKPTPTTGDLNAVLANLTPGQHVPVVIERPDQTQATFQVTLGQLPG